jgi:hypothetical protein
MKPGRRRHEEPQRTGVKDRTNGSAPQQKSNPAAAQGSALRETTREANPNTTLEMKTEHGSGLNAQVEGRRLNTPEWKCFKKFG